MRGVGSIHGMLDVNEDDGAPERNVKSGDGPWLKKIPVTIGSWAASAPRRIGCGGGRLRLRRPPVDPVEHQHKREDQNDHDTRQDRHVLEGVFGHHPLYPAVNTRPAPKDGCWTALRSIAFKCRALF